MATRTYRDAINSLNSLQSNAATLEAVRASGGRLSAFAIPEMLEYLQGIGHKPEDLNVLNVIHITGTKGKGSTSAFVDSILRHSRPGFKVGLYTSPHLVAVRERIRINGTPISEEDFAKYFFEVWDKLEKDFKPKETTPPMPGYFRFVTLLAFHVFLHQKIDATVLEVGVGGTYDSTNIVPKPIVTGVTALGIDHVTVLGKTLADIAWQKGGIYKEGVPAYTVDQPEEGMTVLKQRAEELKASSFTIVPSVSGLSDVKLGLAGAHQVQNAALAVHLARDFLSKTSSAPTCDEELPPSFIDGLEKTKWPGRCQMVQDPAEGSLTRWFLDGAHTLESLQWCMQWYTSPGVGIRQAKTSKRLRVLVFNCTGGRNGLPFLGAMLERTKQQLAVTSSIDELESFFDQVIFCANVTYADGGFKGDLTAVGIAPTDLAQLKTQQELASAWRSLLPNFPEKSIHVLPSIEHANRAIDGLQAPDTEVDVLVTGSLHLVGGVIEVAGLSDVAL